MKIGKRLCLAGLAMLWLAACSDSDSPLPQAADGSILARHAKSWSPISLNWKLKQPTVIEFMSFGCYACFLADPYVRHFEEHKPAGVRMIRYQVSLRRNRSEDLTRAAYTTALLAGQESRIHDPLFNFYAADKTFATIQDVESFLDAAGVGESLNARLESPDTKSAEATIERMARQAQITGTPTFVVNGRYKVQWGNHMSHEEFTDLLTALAMKTP
jgi:protein dithiol oxidoreductase (disulfide-forming)